MATILGSGLMSDAFLFAFLFPNYFRAIFGEGTINPAFLPRYAALHAKGEHDAAAPLRRSIFAWQMAAQAVLLLLAMVAHAAVGACLCAGLRGGAEVLTASWHVSLFPI